MIGQRESLVVVNLARMARDEGKSFGSHCRAEREMREGMKGILTYT